MKLKTVNIELDSREIEIIKLALEFYAEQKDDNNQIELLAADFNNLAIMD